MTDEERNKMKAWVDNWKTLGPILEKLKREESKSANLEETILAMDSAFRSAIYLSPPKKTSGLVDFHLIMAKSR
jgi:hypothetical protein